ncbi:hypothetical protein F5B17DRAFT_155721 [Nemania serpens]|nr:hypothetical protein F5B17DRAFT_155721 [Nemania serpens]
MSSRDSSTGSSSTGAVRQDNFRSSKSKGYRVERVEREISNGTHVVTWNHHARGFDQHVPTPSYSDSSAYKKTKKPKKP